MKNSQKLTREELKSVAAGLKNVGDCPTQGEPCSGIHPDGTTYLGMWQGTNMVPMPGGYGTNPYDERCWCAPWIAPE